MGGRRSSGLSLERATVVVLGFYLALPALNSLRRGRWLYTDYLGLKVPAPLALAAGILLLVVGTAWWRRLLREL